MSPRSDQNKFIDWLNTLIVMSQWDRTLPLYFARLYQQADQYQRALPFFKEQITGGSSEPLGDALSKEEWQRLFKVTTSSESLRRLFAELNDPFYGAKANEISVLAEVADLTTYPKTIFYSRNGAFQQVFAAVRQHPVLDATPLFTEGFNKFYTLQVANESVAEDFYELACSNHWYSVLESLLYRRDYASDDSPAAKQSLDQWDNKLTRELRTTIFQKIELYKVPKRLVKLAWERRDLFAGARNRISYSAGQSDFEIHQQVANIVYPMFMEVAKDEMQAIESDLQLLAKVARHFIDMRRFAKLDGLVYAWPKVASLAMANYANLEYVEDFFIERKPRPSDEELDARDAGELYELCASNSGLIRFLKLPPFFKDINENELRRYRPLAPVTISDQPQQPQTQVISPPSIESRAAVAPPSVVTRPLVCELKIITSLGRPDDFADKEFEYEIQLTVRDAPPVIGITKFSIRELLKRTLASVGATSEESLQSIMKNLFSGTNAEQIIARGGSQLLHTFITQAKLDDAFAGAFKGDGPVRLIIRCEVQELQYLPWEWLPRPGYSELLLSNARFSIVRTRAALSDLPPPALGSPIRILGVFPNSPVGRREISENSIKSLESLADAGAQYIPLPRDAANMIRVNAELDQFHPQIVHFEGFVAVVPAYGPVFVFSYSGSSPVSSEELSPFASRMVKAGVQLLVISRNESSRTFDNGGAMAGYRLVGYGVPVTLAAIRAVEDVTATSFTTEFYQSFLSGHRLEEALHIARRKVASRGGDWTAFALFANPSVLDYFQSVTPTA